MRKLENWVKTDVTGTQQLNIVGFGIEQSNWFRFGFPSTNSKCQITEVYKLLRRWFKAHPRCILNHSSSLGWWGNGCREVGNLNFRVQWGGWKPPTPHPWTYVQDLYSLNTHFRNDSSSENEIPTVVFKNCKIYAFMLKHPLSNSLIGFQTQE